MRRWRRCGWSRPCRRRHRRGWRLPVPALTGGRFGTGLAAARAAGGGRIDLRLVLTSAFASGCGCVTASCSGGGDCGGVGSGSLTYLASSACALASSLPPSTFCSFIVLEPRLDHRLGRFAPMRDGFRQQRDDESPRSHHHVGRPRGLHVPHRARHAGGRLARIAVDHGFQSRAAADRKLRLVHRQHERRACSAKVGKIRCGS